MSDGQISPRNVLQCSCLKQFLLAAFGMACWMQGANAGPLARQTAELQLAQVQPASPDAAKPAANENSAPSATPPKQTPAAAVPVKTEETPAVVVNSQQMESILGKKVRSASGDDMGRIVDIIADKSGQLRAAIIDFGGFLGVGSKQIAVDWKAIRFAPEAKLNAKPDAKTDAVILDLTRDQLRVAPAYKAGEQIVILGQSAAASNPRPADAPASTTAPRAQEPPAK